MNGLIYHILDFCCFFLAGGLGFHFLFEYDLGDWEWWVTVIPLLFVAHQGTIWLAQNKDSCNKTNKKEV